MKDQLWVVQQVADYIGVSAKWVYRHQKEIPGWIKIGSLIRFNPKILIEECSKPVKRGQGSLTGNPFDL